MAILIISLPLVLAEEYSLLYDANGNLVYDQETDIYREYNELNQLIRIRINNASGTILQEYVWDPIEEKIFIKDEFYSNGSLKSSTYYFSDDYVVIQNSSGTFNQTYIYQDGVLVGYEDVDGKKRYVLPDHEGSVHVVLNESGDVIEENLFSPFAEPLAGVQTSKFSYEAKEYDSLVKDYDFHFRKLRTTGPPIFTQPDTLIQNVYDPQSLNRYSFERNNPVNHIDPTGHVLSLLFWFGIAFILAAGYSGYRLASQLTTIEKAEGSLSNSDVTMAFLNIALIVFPIKSFSQTPVQSISQFGLKSSGKLAYAGYFDKRIANLENDPEPEKPEVDEDLKCKIINCNFEYKANTKDTEGKQQSGNSPSTSNPSSQADSSKAISQSAQQNTNQASGGYVSGIGYVTSGGSVYPTSNPYFSPGTGNAPWGGSYSNVVQDPSTGNWVIAE